MIKNEIVLVSIVIPAYNAEKYISSCLDSVLTQSYKHLQIIIVDDGSTDSTLSICELYKNKDDRITLIHKANSGVSSARNMGLKYTKGKYVCFCDSDDLLKTDYIEIMLANAEKYDSPLTVCAYESFPSVDNLKKAELKGETPLILNKTDCLENIVLNDKFGGYICNKFFLTSIASKISFREEIHFKEDLLFCLEYLEHIDKCISISDVLYFYRINSLGASRGEFNIKKTSSIISDQYILEILKNGKYNNKLFMNIYLEFYFSCATYFLKIFFSKIVNRRMLLKDIVKRFYDSREKIKIFNLRKWTIKQRLELIAFNILKTFFKAKS